jgi:N-acetylneuraminic acid mutarotase
VYLAAAAGHDGNIYVFGGENGPYVDTNTTFIYHPGSNTWTQGVNVPITGEGAHAVTLSSGQIAVLGGGTGGACGPTLCLITSTVELYTPGTNRWIALAPMLTPRYRFAAVLGGDGRVYAIGGFGPGGQVLSSVEAYTPSLNRWSYVFSLPQGEVGLTAAVAPNGTIVVMGGSNGGSGSGVTYYNNVWLYNAQTGWSSGAPMPTARHDLAATTGPDGQIYAIGGYNSSGFVATVEAYNPSTNSWSSAPSLPVITCCLTAVTGLTGQVYAIGGGGSPGGGSAVDVLNLPSAPPTATPTPVPPPVWTLPTSLPAPRAYPAAAVGSDGNIYVFGGTDSSIDYNTTFIYHPGTNTWTQGANMPTARAGAQAVLLDSNHIAVLGGGTGCHFTQTCTIYNKVEIYTPSTNTWSTAAPMLTPRYRFAAVGGGGHLYAIGGWDGTQALSTTEVYSETTNSWSYFTSLPQAEEAPGAAVAHGTLVVMGGYDGQANSTYYNNVWFYTASGWSSGAPMPTARQGLGAATGPDGRIYAIGGYNSSSYVSTVEAYSITTNSWSSTTSLPAPTCCMAAVAVPAGQIYAIGGAGNPSAGPQVAVLNFTPVPPTITPTATSTPTTAPTPTSTAGPTIVNVPVTKPWTDTGIDVTAGATISVTASGSASFAVGPGNSYTPAGQAGCVHGEAQLAPGLTCFSLVARIGNGVPFEVGTGLTWQAATSGRLGLGVNDDYFGDNSGSWTAAITVH